MLTSVFDPENITRIYKPTGVEESTHFPQNCKKVALIFVAITSIATTGSFFAGLVTAKTALYTITTISAGILSISVMVNQYAQKNWYTPAQPHPQPHPQTEASGSGGNEGKSEIIEIDTEQFKRNKEMPIKLIFFTGKELSDDELQLFQNLYDKSRPHPQDPPLINGQTPLHRSQIKNPKLVELL
jgi:hypothetical protein